MNKLPVIILWFGFAFAFGYDLQTSPFSIVTPQSWELVPSDPPNLLIARSTIPSQNLSKGGLSAFTNNMVIQKIQINQKQLVLFKKDPIFYLEVALYQSLPTLDIKVARPRMVNGIRGIYMLTEMEVQGTTVSNIQYHFVDGGYQYDLTFSCLAQDFEKTQQLLEASLESLRRRQEKY